MRRFFISLLSLVALVTVAQDIEKYPWLNRSLSFRERATLLVKELTLEEKAGQFGSIVTDQVMRDGVIILPHYQYWNEAIHGYARMGNATSFPESKGMSATWDPELVYQCANAISTEARAYHNFKTNQRKGVVKGWKVGLNVWSPTINMARDPRWGREEENYGEDPFLCGVLATQFVKGMQGKQTKDNPYYKIVACAKHFAANNYEYGRHNTTSFVSEKNMREYYLPAFEMCVRDGGVKSIMAAYNAFSTDVNEKDANGEGYKQGKGGLPCSGNRMLLTDILRKEWGFTGYVTSDCAAVSDVYRATKHLYFGNYTVGTIDRNAEKWRDPYQNSNEQEKMMEARATAMCLNAGLNSNCEQYSSSAVLQRALLNALSDDYRKADKLGYVNLTEETVDNALIDILETRFALGEFDEDYISIPWNNVSPSDLESPAHQALALKAAQESITLLKNEGNILPIPASASVALIGPYADAIQLGDYSGTPTYTITPYQAFSKKVKCKMLTTSSGVNEEASQEMIDRAIALANQVDYVIFLGGTDWTKPKSHETGTEGHDRWTITLPGNQAEVINALKEANPNTIVVLESASCLDLTAIKSVPVILEAWYGGQAQGQAICDAILGDVNPSGHLTSTWYADLYELPQASESGIGKYGANGMLEYNIDDWGYTYMYYGKATKKKQKGIPQFPFGFGLSYTTFAYTAATATAPTKEKDGEVKVTIKNTGNRFGADVIQIYADFIGNSHYGNLNKRLVGFKRVELNAGEEKTVSIPVNYRNLSYYNEASHQYLVDGRQVNLQVSTSSADADVKHVVSITPLAGVAQETYISAHIDEMLTICGANELLQTDHIYSVMGAYVCSASDFDTLPNGVYVLNGEKYIKK